MQSSTIEYQAVKNKTLVSILVFMIVISCQLTDVTVGPVKFWELFAIVFFPFFIKRIERKMLWFFSAFTVLLFLSVFVGLFTSVNYSYFSPLKSKYVISLVRYIELILCLVVALLPFNMFKSYNLDFNSLVKKYITYNVIFTIGVLLLLVVDLVLKTSLVTYGSGYRLRGFYVEGGPYGLFISTLIFLEMSFFQRKKHLLVLFLALVLSASKAGYVAAILFIMFILFQKYKFLRGFLTPNNPLRFLSALIITAAIGVGVTYKVANNYYEDIQNIDAVLKERANDTSLVMGRIAASSIAPRILEDNPAFGVGLGAYSLVRNNLSYRGAFPVVNGWDLTGLGGFFNLLVENGIIGLLVFCFAIIKYFNFNNVGVYFLILFTLPFFFGAQLYMVYPWLYLGFYYLFRQSDN